MLTSSTALQPRLGITAPGDIHEQEADRIADVVMRMPEGECTTCAEHWTPPRLARKAPAAEPVSVVPASVGETLHGGGRQLDVGVRRFMESRFGAEFAGVRIHTDARAARSAADVSARAYTVGHHIAFGAGEYSPDAGAGRALIAHELAHVLQQSEGGAPRLARQPTPGDSKSTSSTTGGPTMPRPPGIPQNASVILQPVDLPPKLMAALEEGVPTRVLPPNPPNLVGKYVDESEGLEGMPVTSVGAATVENVSATLTTFGFKSAPGGNAIGMIGFPGKGLGWGHSAVYVRVDGKILVTRGFMPASRLEALVTPGVKGGTASIPAVISNDTALFLRDAAQIIEYPVPKDAALKAAAELPPVGPPPEGFAQRYTARPGVKGDPVASNCVGFGCEFVESRLGGKVGAEKIGPVTEPVNPATEGLQGRFMKASGPNSGELTPMPEGTGPGVRGAMPTSYTVLKWGGRAFLVVGGVLAVAAVIRAPEEEKARTAAVEGGGFLAGVALGATAGLFCGPGAPVCSVVLGLVLGVAGAMAGREVGELVYDEAVGDADAVLEWLRTHDAEGLRQQQPRTKIQMILALMTGWIGSEDVAAIDQICASVQSSIEAAMIRAAIEPRIVPNMKSIGQRTQVRVSLAQMPR